MYRNGGWGGGESLPSSLGQNNKTPSHLLKSAGKREQIRKVNTGAGI